jgi:hypothetical protein
LPRIRAEQLLYDELVGTFLIRESEHYPGDLTLSIKDDAKIQHYRVKLDPIRHTYTVDDEIFFPDLRLLVEVSIGHSLYLEFPVRFFSIMNWMPMDCVVDWKKR